MLGNFEGFHKKNNNIDARYKEMIKAYHTAIS